MAEPTLRFRSSRFGGFRGGGRWGGLGVPGSPKDVKLYRCSGIPEGVDLSTCRGSSL